jgi:phosphatidylglycerophosphatase A
MSIPKNNTIIFLATWGLIGFSPVAPGTFGTIAALPLCLWMASLGDLSGGVFLVLLTAASIWIAHCAAEITGKKDPGTVVIDEVCGMVVALFALPFTPFFVVGGFFLFRAFDTLKPWPIRWADKKIPGGIGIILDDIIAGIFTNTLLRIGACLL